VVAVVGQRGDAKFDRADARPAVEALEVRRLLAATYYVSVTGDDNNPGTDPSLPWRHVQKAFDAATPGSTVNVMAGRYNERPVLNVSGNATDGFITFQANGKAVISAKKIPGADVISINNRNYVKIIGFEIRDNLKVSNGSGIRLTEANSFIEIRNNRIMNMKGQNAMGITVYGTEPTRGISNLVIDGNEVFKVQSAPSEALVLNGNVHDFVVSNNYVHHVNNIGIDFIGGEGRSPDPTTDFVRNGLVSGNRVTRASFKGGGRDAAGVYVDGAENVVVERNFVWRNDVGIEVNALHPSRVASGIVVRDNVIAGNNTVGLSVGGTDLATGSVQGCTFTNNTLYRNDAKRTGVGELRIQRASSNVIENNLVSGRGGSLLVNVEPTAGANALNYNLYFSPDGEARARFAWGGPALSGFGAFRTASGQDAASLFANPLLLRPGKTDAHVAGTSPAVNAGDPLFTGAPGEADVDNQPRVLGGRVDIGADEAA
jgi:hypothetical protein